MPAAADRARKSEDDATAPREPEMALRAARPAQRMQVEIIFMTGKGEDKDKDKDKDKDEANGKRRLPGNAML